MRKMRKFDDIDIIEKEISRQRIYSGKILDLDKATVILPNGNEAFREIIVHKGAAAILPINDKGEAAMVRQYRAALGEVTLEIPAGKLDSLSEDPLDCAVRELREETGLSAENMRLLVRMLPAIGYSNEVISVYLATGLSQSQASPDDDEFINLNWIPFGELFEAAMAGEITDSKTLTAILMAKELL